MSEVEFPPEEMVHLAYLSNAAMEDSAEAVRMIELAKRPERKFTAKYLGVLAVIQNTCIDSNGVLAPREDIIREGLELLGEESIFRTAGYALVTAAELWLHHAGSLTDEQQFLDEQIGFWRETQTAQMAFWPSDSQTA